MSRGARHGASRSSSRGMTLLELLLALGLLGALMVGVAAWTRTVTDLTTRYAPEVRARAAAQEVLQLIGEDLLIGDAARDRRTRPERPRVQLDGGTLILRTRAAGTDARVGSVEHHYVFDEADGTLTRQSRGASGGTERLLLAQITEWVCAVDDDRRHLDVALVTAADVRVTRRYRLP